MRERKVNPREEVIIQAHLKGSITDEQAGAAIALLREEQQLEQSIGTPTEIVASGQALAEALTHPTLWPNQPDEQINRIRVDAARVVEVLKGELLAASFANNPDSRPTPPTRQVAVSRRGFLRMARTAVAAVGVTPFLTTPAAGMFAASAEGGNVGRQKQEEYLQALVAQLEGLYPERGIAEFRSLEELEAYRQGRDGLNQAQEKFRQIQFNRTCTPLLASFFGLTIPLALRMIAFVALVAISDEDNTKMKEIQSSPIRYL